MAEPEYILQGDEMAILVRTFDALAIRDTADHTGTTVDNSTVRVKTIVVENTLNQSVTFQCEASLDDSFTSIIPVGTEWSVDASTTIYQTCDTFFPYTRLMASCDTAPSSGDLTVTFARYGG